MDQPLPGAPRHLPPLEVVLRANLAGEAVMPISWSTWLRPPPHSNAITARGGHRTCGKLSARTAHPLLEQYPVLQRLVPLLRARILEIELARGEMPTPATPLALSLRHSGGLPIFVRTAGSTGLGRPGARLSRLQ